MRILACTDGSEHSFRAVEEAAKIAAGLEDAVVTVINVDEVMPDIPYFSEESLKEMEEKNRAEREQILDKAAELLREKNVNFKTIIKKGHPADTIIDLAANEGYDMVVIGSRGFGNIKQKLLGSVSNAVAQQVGANVLIVK